MLQNSKIRKKALEALEGNWGSAALMVVIFYAVEFALLGAGSFILPTTTVLIGEIPAEVSPFNQFLSLLLLPLAFALTVIYLGLIRGKRLLAGDMFKYYGKLSVWALQILMYIFTALWALLFIIPGIIKYYSYSMAPYILKDNPEIGADKAINESMKMMKGFKMKLFLLDLSFIGWGLLCVLTLGLGLFLLLPYVLSSRAVFYEELKAERGIDAPLAREVA